MRVITGIARGRKLETLPGLAVRPTTERVKEAVFSAIQFEIESAFVLDLFAGSGQLGIEALSRGARTCVFVDAARESTEVVKRNLTHCGLMSSARVVMMDALAYLRSCRDTIDIALLDPPYQKGILDEALPMLVPHMNEGGVILCETDEREELPEQVGDFKVVRTYHHSTTKITMYRKAVEA